MGLKSVGGMWKRTGAKGEFLSGRIEVNGEVVKFIAFHNEYKEPGDKKPDWRIVQSDEEGEQRPKITDEDVPF